MTYEVEEDRASRLVAVTSRGTRRGRGVLFATAPLVVYLAFASALLAIAARDVTLLDRVKAALLGGAGVAAGLCAGCFALGYRMRDRLVAEAGSLRLERTPPAGATRTLSLEVAELAGLAVDPSLRSLGADVLLVAVRRDGARVPLLEGDPHSDQIRDLARRVSRIAALPVEAPRFTSMGGGT